MIITLIWLLFGACIGAFICAKRKIPPRDLRHDEGNPLFIGIVIYSAVAWPLMILGLLFYYPVMWVYRKAAKEPTKP